MITSIDAEEPLTKFNILHNKAISKLRIEEMYLNIIKAVWDKSIVSIILNGEKLKPYPL
jgi:hypothetical protein